MGPERYGSWDCAKRIGAKTDAISSHASHRAKEGICGPEMHDAKANPAWTWGRMARIESDRTTCSIRFAGVAGDSQEAG